MFIIYIGNEYSSIILHCCVYETIIQTKLWRKIQSWSVKLGVTQRISATTTLERQWNIEISRIGNV